MSGSDGYRVKKTWRGQRIVQFKCKHCTADLSSPLREAGEKFPCPTCDQEFVTPGKLELQEIREQERLESEAVAEQESFKSLPMQEVEQSSQDHSREQLSRRSLLLPLTISAFTLLLIYDFALHFTIITPLQQRTEALEERLDDEIARREVVERDALRLQANLEAQELFLERAIDASATDHANFARSINNIQDRIDAIIRAF